MEKEVYGMFEREREKILFVFIGKEDVGEQDGESQLMIGQSIAMLQV